MNPSKWEDSFVERAQKICARGFSQEALADAFGVSVKTIEHWSAERPEFREAMRRGRYDFACNELEGTLFTSASGYFKNEETWETRKVKSWDFETDEEVILEELVLVKRVKKFFPPNVTAIIFALKNRLPDRWKDVNKLEIEDLKPLADRLAEARKNEAKREQRGS